MWARRPRPYLPPDTGAVPAPYFFFRTPSGGGIANYRLKLFPLLDGHPSRFDDSTERTQRQIAIGVGRDGDLHARFGMTHHSVLAAAEGSFITESTELAQDIPRGYGG